MPPIVFISCGQRHAFEIEMGNALCDIVEGVGYEPFFAQRNSDLRGLSEVIFDTLSRSSAYIAVLHRREKLDSEEIHRASLFIEQELALAAYLRRARELPVLFYVQKGVERAGVRSTLLLNVSLPERDVFEENAEVLEHVRVALPKLNILPVMARGQNLRLEVKPTWERAGGGLMMMRILVFIRNAGIEIPNHAILRVWVPHEFEMPTNQQGRAGHDGDFNVVQRTVEQAAHIDPDPERPTLMIAVSVPMIRGFAEKVFRFRLVAGGQEPTELRFRYDALWKAADAAAVLA